MVTFGVLVAGGVPHPLGGGWARPGEEVPASRVVLVGDTPRDVAAARRAGCGVVAVATGRHTVEELTGQGPDAVLADLADPAALLRACERALGHARGPAAG